MESLLDVIGNENLMIHILNRIPFLDEPQDYILFYNKLRLLNKKIKETIDLNICEILYKIYRKECNNLHSYLECDPFTKTYKQIVNNSYIVPEKVYHLSNTYNPTTVNKQLLNLLDLNQVDETTEEIGYIRWDINNLDIINIQFTACILNIYDKNFDFLYNIINNIMLEYDHHKIVTNQSLAEIYKKRKSNLLDYLKYKINSNYVQNSVSYCGSYKHNSYLFMNIIETLYSKKYNHNESIQLYQNNILFTNIIQKFISKLEINNNINILLHLVNILIKIKYSSEYYDLKLSDSANHNLFILFLKSYNELKLNPPVTKHLIEMFTLYDVEKLFEYILSDNDGYVDLQLINKLTEIDFYTNDSKIIPVYNSSKYTENYLNCLYIKTNYSRIEKMLDLSESDINNMITEEFISFIKIYLHRSRYNNVDISNISDSTLHNIRTKFISNYLNLYFNIEIFNKNYKNDEIITEINIIRTGCSSNEISSNIKNNFIDIYTKYIHIIENDINQDFNQILYYILKCYVNTSKYFDKENYIDYFNCFKKKYQHYIKSDIITIEIGNKQDKLYL